MFERFSFPTKFAETTLTYDVEVSAQLANYTELHVVHGLIGRYEDIYILSPEHTRNVVT